LNIIIRIINKNDKGTINTGLYSQHGFQIITRTQLRLNAEAELNYDFHFPFVYNRYSANELPDRNCVKKRYSFFRVITDFSGYNF